MPFEPTPEQQIILDHTPEHDARILAGPGTGKSTTMVALLSRLRKSEKPPNAKMLTFTRAATSELAEKLEEVPGDFERPSTIHSFAISVLLQNPGVGGFPEPLRIADTWESKNIVVPTLATRVKVRVRVLKKLIAEMASNWQSLTGVADLEIQDEDRSRFRAVWPEHRTVLGYTLLDELPYALRRALHDHDDLAGIDYDVLIVDEYQDLNACDLEAIRLLHERSGCTVIGAGDDDQSIYSGRKAAPAGIRRFLDDYDGAADYVLSITLRCGKRIIEWASYVIQSDPDRDRNRASLSCLGSAPVGDTALLSFKGNKSEVKGVAALVKGLIDHEGLLPSQILVLVRTDHNRQFSKPISTELEILGIQCCDPHHVIEVLAEPENRLCLEAMRLLVRRDDSLAWASVLNLTGGVGQIFFDYIYEQAKSGVQTFASTLLGQCRREFKGAPKAPAERASGMIETLVGWIDTVSLPEGSGRVAWGAWMLDVLQGWPFSGPTEEFRELVLALDELAEEELTLERYLNQIEPLGRDMALAQADGVRVMTMGGSKGLTVRAVIIVGVEEGLVPRPDSPMGEECRILYVAMTRAREYLYCTWARRRRGPTARSGRGTSNRRCHSHFFDGGPISSEDGPSFIKGRFL